MKHEKEEAKRKNVRKAKQDRQVNKVAVEKKVLCVCNLSDPKCNAHAPYYIVICGLPGCTVFYLLCIINGMIFGKKYYRSQNLYLDFVYNICLENFLL
jgi:hypothetical protein